MIDSDLQLARPDSLLGAVLAEILNYQGIPHVVIEHPQSTVSLADKRELIAGDWHNLQPLLSKKLVINEPPHSYVWLAYAVSMAGYANKIPFVATTLTGTAEARWNPREKQAIASAVTQDPEAVANILNIGSHSGLNITQYGWELGSVGPFPTKPIRRVWVQRPHYDEDELTVTARTLIAVNFALSSRHSLFIPEHQVSKFIQLYGGYLQGDFPLNLYLPTHEQQDVMIFPKKPELI